jgi:mannitol-specific phosphotransferase system IIBC component
MKALLSFFFLLFVITTYAQTFEGTIAWSIKTEITDPKMKAKMEQAQKQMSDPANQAKMKQMQEQMNSPQMKAMLESNPQMKTQMQNAMKAMQGGEMSSMMPKSFIRETKRKNSLTKMDGGIMAAEILALNDKNETYMLDRESKTYSLLPSGNDETTSKATHKVTKTSETTQYSKSPMHKIYC